MKELYISPEVELIGFVAEERLATNIDFGDMDGTNFNPELGGSNAEESQVGDIRLPFPKL